MRPLLHLSCALAGLVLAIGSPALAQLDPQLFISPMGEPFRAAGDAPYPSATWFAGADADHDGIITRSEFRDDAKRFFNVLDTNKDGLITDLEVQRYEYILAPEIIQATSDTSATPANGDPDSSYKHTPLSTVKQGAANFGFLEDPEPVRSTDVMFNRKITLDEWMAAADRRFDLLVADGQVGLRMQDLPTPPNQKLAAAAQKGLKGHKKDK